MKKKTAIHIGNCEKCGKSQYELYSINIKSPIYFTCKCNKFFPQYNISKSWIVKNYNIK